MQRLSSHDDAYYLWKWTLKSNIELVRNNMLQTRYRNFQEMEQIKSMLMMKICVGNLITFSWRETSTILHLLRLEWQNSQLWATSNTDSQRRRCTASDYCWLSTCTKQDRNTRPAESTSWNSKSCFYIWRKWTSRQTSFTWRVNTEVSANHLTPHHIKLAASFYFGRSPQRSLNVQLYTSRLLLA